MFCSLLSLYFPRAMNCCVRPFGIEGVGGVTDSEINTALVTVSEAVAFFPE